MCRLLREGKVCWSFFLHDKFIITVFHFWSPERGLGKSFIVGSILPNPGNPLELQVPRYILKGISGWTNHSCTVTNQEASERSAGDRGSKSVILKNIAVKEQRVYGSWCGVSLPHLRCTLTGFGKNYQVKIPSNLIIQRRLYSTESSLNKDIYQLPPLNEPWFISGFTSFFLIFFF